MRQLFTLVFPLIAALRLGAALGQAETHVAIRILDTTCLVYLLHVPCRDVGSKLQELGTPSNVTMDVRPQDSANSEAVAAALESLKRAGFTFKVDHVDIRDP